MKSFIMAVHFFEHFKDGCLFLKLADYCEHTELQRRSGLSACKRLIS